MKKVLIVFLCLFISIKGESQKNKVEVGVGGYKFYNVIGQMDNLINMLNIKYERRVAEKLGIYVQYSRLPINGWLLAQENIGAAKESVGKLTSRNNYSYFDLGARYTLFRYQKHNLSAVAGLSVAYGVDEYLISVVWTNPEPGEPYGHPIYATREEQKHKYLGGILGIRYDYTFWKKRINIGPDFCLRYYSNNYPFQTNYSIHAGFNF